MSLNEHHGSRHSTYSAAVLGDLRRIRTRNRRIRSPRSYVVARTSGTSHLTNLQKFGLPQEFAVSCAYYPVPFRLRYFRLPVGRRVLEHAAREERAAICLICESPWPPARSARLGDNLCLTERGTPARGIFSEWHFGYGYLEAPVR